MRPRVTRALRALADTLRARRPPRCRAPLLPRHGLPGTVPTCRAVDARFKPVHLGCSDRCTVPSASRPPSAPRVLQIFVVDSNDHQRLHEAGSELHAVLRDETLGNPIVLVYANKCVERHQPAQWRARANAIWDDTWGCPRTRSRLRRSDLPGVLTPSAIADGLKLHSLRHTWYIQQASAVRGEGIFEGLEWLSAQINKRPTKTARY